MVPIELSLPSLYLHFLGFIQLLLLSSLTVLLSVLIESHADETFTGNMAASPPAESGFLTKFQYNHHGSRNFFWGEGLEYP